MELIGLSTLWLFLMAGCAALFFFIAMAGLLGWFLWRGRQPLAAAELERAEREANRCFASETGYLIPWGSESFTDMAAEWEGTYRRLLGFNAHGRCPSLQSPDRSIFHTWVSRRGSTGILFARTSRPEVRIIFDRGIVSPFVDGRLLGFFELRTGRILDLNREPVGSCAHGPGAGLFFQGIPLGKAHRAYRLVLHDRAIATLTAAASSGVFERPVPLVKDLVPGLKTEDRDWLLAMCVLEIGYYAPLRKLHRHRVMRQ